MLGHRMTEAIGQQQWLDATGDLLQRAVAGAFNSGGTAGRRVKNVLHGSWLGHALHPALTDIPVGAWSAALALDALDLLGDGKQYARGADAAITVGLAGAVGALLTGLAEYQHLSGKPRRVGLVHGLTNVAVTSLYAGALVARRRHERNLGRALAAAGYSVAMFSAYLGGELVFQMKIGVNHAPAEPPPQEFVPVLAEEKLDEGQLRAVDIGGTQVMLARQDGRIFALANSCSHLGCALSEGQLEGQSVRCNCHGSRFALDTGKVLDSPASTPQPVYETRIRDGTIEVRRAEGARAQKRSIGA